MRRYWRLIQDNGPLILAIAVLGWFLLKLLGIS